MKRVVLRAVKRAVLRAVRRSVLRRKTRVLHVGRRDGARRVRAGCAPRARARGAGRPVRPFSSRSGLPELRGRAAGGRRHARRGLQVRSASSAQLKALARLEPKPGRRKVPPGFAVYFQRQKESGAKHRKKTRRFKSQPRACARTYWRLEQLLIDRSASLSFLENAFLKKNTILKNERTQIQNCSYFLSKLSIFIFSLLILVMQWVETT